MSGTSLEIVENPFGVDFTKLRELITKSYAYMDGRVDPPSSLHQMDVADFEQKARNETLIICTIDDRLAGCAYCRDEGDWLYIGKVAVSENLRGQGIGRALFEQAFQIARRKKAMGLELETRIELVENHRAFEKLGFLKTGDTAHAGYEHPTAITMRAKL